MKKIKHSFRDVLIFFISISGIAYLYRNTQRKNGPLVRVLCFHDVPDRSWFASVLSMLLENCNVVTPEQFHNGAFEAGKINILLTFDDGYQSWVDICLPELQQKGVKGLFFINSGLLDIADNKQMVERFMQEKLLITPKEPLTWRGAQTLLDAGHTIGGHTVNHARLSQINTESVFEEVHKDKKRIEEKLGITLKDFAYPFGTKQDYSKKTMQEVTKAGYTSQYSAVSGFYQQSKTIIPRMLLEEKQSLKLVQLWIEGGYDVLVSLK